MNKLTISIFGNQIFQEIINKLDLFSKYKIISCESSDFFIKNKEKGDHLIIFFLTEDNEKDYNKIKKENYPTILIKRIFKKSIKFSGELVEQLNMPFSIIDLNSKIVSLLARYKFKKSSLINLHDYIIDKNERKIKKNELELQLTEKEINFLILFSHNNKPLSRGFILEKVWNYSTETDTHTVETHIHRLRKKILDKFKDNNFIKNNDKGYYI